MNQSLEDRFKQVRSQSEQFCESLEVEDFGLQAMPETSPAKWHLAHTSWFFETFIIKAFNSNYTSQWPGFEVLFNSYYNSIGEQHPRAERGLLSRPTVRDVLNYRADITNRMLDLLQEGDEEVARLTELGLHHERQHQELFFTDLKYNFSRNPTWPAYRSDRPESADNSLTHEWLEYGGGEASMGHNGEGFCFDNETPGHKVLLQDFAIASQLVSNGQYLQFMTDDGYRRPELWLADGWATVQDQRWQHPLYWHQVDGEWFEFTLYGLIPLDLNRPVTHISGYEADAYCRWADCRLPTEFEWERAAQEATFGGQLLEQDIVHPWHNTPGQLFGSAWQWTSSAYGPYPGFRADPGAVGEYNGKFMANQLVLRGGSCVSAGDHIRASYRNFFYPPDRWQFTGIRMAKWL